MISASLSRNPLNDWHISPTSLFFRESMACRISTLLNFVRQMVMAVANASVTMTMFTEMNCVRSYTIASPIRFQYVQSY